RDFHVTGVQTCALPISLQRDRAYLFAHADEALEPAASHAFAELIQRRQRGEPIAYLTGTRGFWTFDLAVTPATLIPRPETELLRSEERRVGKACRTRTT